MFGKLKKLSGKNKHPFGLSKEFWIIVSIIILLIAGVLMYVKIGSEVVMSSEAAGTADSAAGTKMCNVPCTPSGKNKPRLTGGGRWTMQCVKIGAKYIWQCNKLPAY